MKIVVTYCEVLESSQVFNIDNVFCDSINEELKRTAILPKDWQPLTPDNFKRCMNGDITYTIEIQGTFMDIASYLIQHFKMYMPQPRSNERVWHIYNNEDDYESDTDEGRALESGLIMKI